MQYKLVIFDFDGTLANSFPWLLSVLDGLADKYRLRRIDQSEIETLRGYTARQMLAYYRVPFWKMLLIGNDFRKWMARDIEQIHLFPGIDRVLEQLSALGVELALVTSNAAANVHKVLGPANAARIDYYECGVSVLGKEGRFEKVIRKSGVRPEEVLCIGDEIRDLEAARKVNLAFGAVSWGYARLEALLAHAPQFVFHSVDDILKHIG